MDGSPSREGELPGKGSAAAAGRTGDAKPEANGLGSDLNSRYDIGDLPLRITLWSNQQRLHLTIGVPIHQLCLPA